MARKNDGGTATSRSGETRDQATRSGRSKAHLTAGTFPAPTKRSQPDEDDDEEEVLDDGMERLNKVLARANVASRRKVDELIRQGKVRLNNEVVTQLGTRVDPRTDRVTVDGKRVTLVTDEAQTKVYFVLNKPAGVLTTVKDDRGRATVMELVKGAHEGRFYPVGRLDYDAEGVLLLTNDGDLASKLMAPKSHVPKIYHVKVKGEPAEDKLDILRKGITLEDGRTRPCEITVIRKARVNTWLEVTLTEGKNRQLKRMFWKIRHPVMKIARMNYAGVDVGDLKVGDHRELTKAEIAELKRQAG